MKLTKKAERYIEVVGKVGKWQTKYKIKENPAAKYAFVVTNKTYSGNDVEVYVDEFIVDDESFEIKQIKSVIGWENVNREATAVFYRMVESETLS